MKDVDIYGVTRVMRHRMHSQNIASFLPAPGMAHITEGAIEVQLRSNNMNSDEVSH